MSLDSTTDISSLSVDSDDEYYAPDCPYAAAFAIIDSCTDADELWRFINPMLKQPDIHVSELVQRYYERFEGETFVSQRDYEQEYKQGRASTKRFPPGNARGHTLVKRLEALSNRFLRNRRQRQGSGCRHGLKSTALRLSERWKVVIETLART